MYMERLAAFPQQLHLHQFSKEVFRMTLSVMGECWRRFDFERQRCPWVFISKLLEVEDIDVFLGIFSEFQSLAEQCHRCIDVEFTAALLNYIPKGACAADPEVCQRVRLLQGFLADLSVYCPLGSDLVECLHGFYQSKLHRFRGSKPTDAAAQQLTLWSSVVRSYQVFRSKMWNAFGDQQAIRRCAAWIRSGACQMVRRSNIGEETVEAERDTNTAVGRSEMRARHLRLEDLNVLAQEGMLPAAKPRCLSGIFARLQEFIFSVYKSVQPLLCLTKGVAIALAMQNRRLNTGSSLLFCSHFWLGSSIVLLIFSVFLGPIFSRSCFFLGGRMMERTLQ